MDHFEYIGIYVLGDIYIYILYPCDIKCITVIHGLMSAGVCLVAHGTEEGLIPENVLHFCTFALFCTIQ